MKTKVLYIALAAELLIWGAAIFEMQISSCSKYIAYHITPPELLCTVAYIPRLFIWFGPIVIFATFIFTLQSPASHLSKGLAALCLALVPIMTLTIFANQSSFTPFWTALFWTAGATIVAIIASATAVSLLGYLGRWTRLVRWTSASCLAIQAALTTWSFLQFEIPHAYNLLDDASVGLVGFVAILLLGPAVLQLWTLQATAKHARR